MERNNGKRSRCPCPADTRPGSRLMPAPDLDPAKLIGGSEADRRGVLERMHAYLDVNARFDWRRLQDIWSGAAEAVFFNLNGHTYKGREHWTRLWQFYENNVRSSYWIPFDIGGVVFQEPAVFWGRRRSPSGSGRPGPPPAARPDRVGTVARSA